MDIIKWFNEEAIHEILSIINACWTQEVMPEQLEPANVVTLYKKGNVQDPWNYRPIALLQSIYRIYASLIQVRLAKRL